MVEKDHGRKLVEYFKKNLSKGYTGESLKWALINQGYSRVEVSRAIKQANKELSEKAPGIDKEKPKITYELYDKDNKLVKIEERKPKKSSSIKSFFRDLFS